MLLTLALGLLILLILIGVPIAISLLAASLVYFFMSGIPLSIVVQQMLQGTSSFLLIAIPMFVLAGELMYLGGTTKRIIRFSSALLGGLRGGLAQTTIFSSMIFSGISGEAVADTSALGKVFIPELKKQGYSKEFSCAVTVGSAVAGPIIPPSLPLIITGSLAGVSIGQLFLGGAIPGLLFIVCIMAFTYVLSLRRSFPRSRSQSTGGFKASLKELRDSFLDGVWALLAPVIIVGGILSGIVTVTEAAVLAVIYTFILGAVVYREFDWKRLGQQVTPTVVTTGAIMFILALAGTYTNLLTRERITQVAADALFGLTDSTSVVLLLIILVALVVGCFLSTTPGLLLLIPVVAPLVAELQTNEVHFLVLVTIALVIGTITPPVGINLYLAAQIGEASPEKVFVALIPYIAILLGILVLSVFIPSIVTWLPSTQLGP